MSRPAVHCAILIVDVESFGDPIRTNANQLAVRDALYKALRQSFAGAHISWAECVAEDRGDGILVFVPATVPKSWLVTRLPARLAELLRQHNAACPEAERIRLRMALHAGEVHQDPHGFTGTSINRAFRMIEAQELRIALRDSPGLIALIVSDWFYDEVVRHHEAAGPSDFRQARIAVKETQMLTWVRVLESAGASGGAEAEEPTEMPGPGPALLSPQAVRYSLPPDTAAFIGREQELARITAVLADAAVTGGVVAICAIDGMPGVGKTALAVHAAHLLRDRFPDRQLFVSLHAHTPGREPVRPEDALGGLLAATGVDPRFLPADLDGRAGMWRDRMAGQRALLVLDNAASSGQVAPLLPGDEGCLVLVTSRRHLGDLPGTVAPVLLDALSPPQAQLMFTRLAPRASASPADVAEAVRLAGFLPLAISLLARVFARHPAWTVADLAAETRDGLLTLTAEDDSVAAAFGVSYRYLEPPLRRLFRLLGLHPGTTTDAYAAAALAGTSLAEAAVMLDRLHGEGLLTETGHRRYGMHDLLRRYAREHAADVEESRHALERLLDYYQRAASLAEACLARQFRPGPLTAAESPAVPDVDSYERALAWARAERASLLACLDYAAGMGEHTRVVALTAALAGLLRHDGPWTEARTRHTAAIQAARHLGDQPGEANARYNLGVIDALTGQYGEAASSLARALELTQAVHDLPLQARVLSEIGRVQYMGSQYGKAAASLASALDISRVLHDPLGEASALNELGVVQRLSGQYAQALASQTQALDLYQTLGDLQGQADTLNNLGRVQYLTARYAMAADSHAKALALYQALRHRPAEGVALNNLGRVQRLTGQHAQAIACHTEALKLSRELGHRLGEANALNDLSVAQYLTGQYDDAAASLATALDLYRALGDLLGQANVLSNLGKMERLKGQYAEATGSLVKALELYVTIDHRLGEADTLNELGVVQRLTGRHTAATASLTRALELSRSLGDRLGEAESLNGLGELSLSSSASTAARAYHEEALAVATQIDSRHQEARALEGLGRCCLRDQQQGEAVAFLHQALSIYQQIKSPDAQRIQAECSAILDANR
jgi:tetratricopeptide (TPR) repeat protein